LQKTCLSADSTFACRYLANLQTFFDDLQKLCLSASNLHLDQKYHLSVHMFAACPKQHLKLNQKNVSVTAIRYSIVNIYYLKEYEIYILNGYVSLICKILHSSNFYYFNLTNNSLWPYKTKFRLQKGVKVSNPKFLKSLTAVDCRIYGRRRGMASRHCRPHRNSHHHCKN